MCEQASECVRESVSGLGRERERERERAALEVFLLSSV